MCTFLEQALLMLFERHNSLCKSRETTRHDLLRRKGISPLQPGRYATSVNPWTSGAFLDQLPAISWDLKPDFLANLRSFGMTVVFRA